MQCALRELRSDTASLAFWFEPLSRGKLLTCIMPFIEEHLLDNDRNLKGLS